MRLLCLISIIVALYGAISARGCQTKSKSCKIGLPEFLPFSHYETRSSILLDERGWESLENKRLKQLAVIMYKIHNNLSPLYLRRIFTNISTVRAHNLRNSEINCYVPRPKTEYAKGSLHYRSYRGSVLWNKIPSEIRHLSSFKTV